MNHAEQVVIRPEALGNDSGNSIMWEGPSDHVGVSSRRQLQKDRVAREWTVPTARLDEVLINTRVDMIKIDVEGFEFEVVKGATEILKRDHPNLIIEITNDFLRECGYTAQEVLLYLSKLGYSATKIEWSGLSHWRVDDILPPQFNAFFYRETPSSSLF